MALNTTADSKIGLLHTFSYPWVQSHISSSIYKKIPR